MSEIRLTPTTEEKLRILADAAKYDVACTSSGVDRKGQNGMLGNSLSCGICHSFAADGRCISLLKVLMTNHCVYDCKYCQNRASNDVERATFEPDELCQLVIEFYKRNYIEGLFLSSGVLKNPNYTMERMCEVLLLLRRKYHFNGYIHVKTIPGASDDMVGMIGYLADRMSINLELPTQESLKKLAPNKSFQTILDPMSKVTDTIAAHRLAIGKDARMERSRVNDFLPNSIFNPASMNQVTGGGNLALQESEATSAPALGLQDTSVVRAHRQLPANFHNDTKLTRPFAPAGQSTQMIIGATEETDLALIKTTQHLYQNYDLKRVFYSAYIPLNEDAALPELGTPVPHLREHRLYQADWLLRYYGYQADELLTEENPFFHEQIDPKCDWAIRHLDQFPVELQTASYDVILRVPGVGPKSAKRIMEARKYGRLTFENLKKMGVVLKRAHYFILCNGRMMYHTPIEQDYILRGLTEVNRKDNWQIVHQNESYQQMDLFQWLGASGREAGGSA